MLNNLRSIHSLLMLFAIGAIPATTGGAETDYKSLTGKSTETAGPFGNLDETTRHFAILKAVDPQRDRVVLLLDGETQPKEYVLIPGTELWCSAWWGRLDQFTVGDRVWIWFEKDREKHPDAIAFMADELSEQHLYAPYQIKAIDASEATAATLTLVSLRDKDPSERTVQLASAEIHQGDARATIGDLQTGETVYIQTTGEDARLVLDADAFERRRATQKSAMEKYWNDEGLPGTVIFLHPELAQIELMLDHEAMQWARSLDEGDEVTLQGTNPVPVVVQQVRPWRERTQVLLSGDALMLAAWPVGQHVRLRLSTPPEDTPENLPLGLGKPRSNAERVEWLMSSIYCTCLMHDMCAGHTFTLAACNAGPDHPCGLAKDTRKEIAEWIDQGQTDRQIFEHLLKERGPKLLEPHMLP